MVPGRAFTRRIYAKCMRKTEHMKPFHHVRIDDKLRADCNVWKEFLAADILMAVSRPYIDVQNPLEAQLLEFYSDASLNGKLGIGARFRPEWMYGKWPENFISECKLSIEYAELLGLVISVHTWAPKLRNRRVMIHCDNQTVVTVVNNTTSSCKNCMMLVRKLVLKCLQFNCRIFAI